MHPKTADELMRAWQLACRMHPDERPGQVFFNAVGDSFYKSPNTIIQDLITYAEDR